MPDLAPFEAPEVGALGAYQLTFHNHCSRTVWPAAAPSGGLESSVIDTQLWLPMAPATDRTVTVYGGVREIGLWGRTGCAFDQTGAGACQTGDCGGAVCPINVNGFPANATIFILDRGFDRGYNIALDVQGTTCGDHACVADVATCASASAVKDSCGVTIACSDICDGTAATCCNQPGTGCSTAPANGGPPDVGDLEITFCP